MLSLHSKAAQSAAAPSTAARRDVTKSANTKGHRRPTVAVRYDEQTLNSIGVSAALIANLVGIGGIGLALQDKVSAGNLKTAEVESKLNLVELKLTQESANVSKLQTDVAVLQADVSVLKGRVTTVQGDVTPLAGKVALVQADVTSLSTTLSTVQTGVSTLTTRVDKQPTEEKITEIMSKYVSDNVSAAVNAEARTAAEKEVEKLMALYDRMLAAKK